MIDRKGEKGLTLVELMAALTILSLVIGVAIALFSSINFEWNSSSKKYMNDQRTSMTMDTITKNLVTATKLIYVDSNEFRFKSEKTYKALVLKDNLLSLFVINKADFENKGINYKDNTSLYYSPITLADNVSSITIELLDTSTPLDIIENGEMIRVSVSFNNEKVNVWGVTSLESVTKTATMKLLVDH